MAVVWRVGACFGMNEEDHARSGNNWQQASQSPCSFELTRVGKRRRKVFRPALCKPSFTKSTATLWRPIEFHVQAEASNAR